MRLFGAASFVAGRSGVNCSSATSRTDGAAALPPRRQAFPGDTSHSASVSRLADKYEPVLAYSLRGHLQKSSLCDCVVVFALKTTTCLGKALWSPPPVGAEETGLGARASQPRARPRRDTWDGHVVLQLLVIGSSVLVQVTTWLLLVTLGVASPPVHPRPTCRGLRLSCGPLRGETAGRRALDSGRVVLTAAESARGAGTGLGFVWWAGLVLTQWPRPETVKNFHLSRHEQERLRYSSLVGKWPFKVVVFCASSPSQRRLCFDVSF